MNITQYQDLSGMTVPSSLKARYKAQIRRTQTILESMLGFTISADKVGVNYYEELGKSQTDFLIPDDDDDLLPPDDVEVAYRLFPYNEADQFLSIDPCLEVYAVKLVYVRGGEEPNGITLKTFALDEYRIQQTQGNIKKYLERTSECWFNWWRRWADTCGCEDYKHVQLAVDADWIFFDCLPDEIKYIWSDMVTYYANPQKDLKSQSLGSHSWTRDTVTPPEGQSSTLTILKKYAGPNGSLRRVVTV